MFLLKGFQEGAYHHLSCTRTRIRPARAITSSRRRSPRAPAACSARATCWAARASSTTCRKSRPTSSSPPSPKSSVSSAVSFLLVAYGAIVAAGLRIASTSHSHFGRMAAAGFTAAFGLYVMINGAMVIGLAPVVGVPMPLMSYGGTVMVTVMVGMGLVQAVRVHRYSELPRGRGLLFLATIDMHVAARSFLVTSRRLPLAAASRCRARRARRHRRLLRRPGADLCGQGFHRRRGADGAPRPAGLRNSGGLRGPRAESAHPDADGVPHRLHHQTIHRGCGAQARGREQTVRRRPRHAVHSRGARVLARRDRAPSAGAHLGHPKLQRRPRRPGRRPGTGRQPRTYIDSGARPAAGGRAPGTRSSSTTTPAYVAARFWSWSA